MTAVWEGVTGTRDHLTFEIWSYLAVGLLFGLTLPGVSAHGFLRGGGWGKGLYSSKTIQGILRERNRDGQREKETESGQKEEGGVGGSENRRQYGEIKKQTGRDGDKSDRETESWRQRPTAGVTRFPFRCQLIFPAGYTRCNLSLSGAAWIFTRTFRFRYLWWSSRQGGTDTGLLVHTRAAVICSMTGCILGLFRERCEFWSEDVKSFKIIWIE